MQRNVRLNSEIFSELSQYCAITRLTTKMNNFNRGNKVLELSSLNDSCQTSYNSKCGFKNGFSADKLLDQNHLLVLLESATALLRLHFRS